MTDLLRRLKRLEALGVEYHVYPDAEEFIQQRCTTSASVRQMEEIRRDPAHHPLRTSLLKIPLLPYQLDGVAFAVGAGRAILADDMGLGKTIQGVGVAELLAPRGGDSQGAGRLPGLAEIAVAERNPPLLRPRRAARRRAGRANGTSNTPTTASSPSATTSRC